MNTIGSLDLAWAQGYSGSEASFINKSTLCVVCGNNIKFIDITNQKETVYPSPGEGVGAFTVSGTQHLVAFSDLCLNPKIFVYSYPGFQEKAICQGGGKLDYNALAISQSHSYLLSCSAIPDFNISLWDWSTGDLLCSKSLGSVAVTSLTFNPTDWHKACTIANKQLTVWNIEQADKKYLLIPTKIKVPFEGETEYRASKRDLVLDDRPGSSVKKQEIQVDDAAKAGLVGEVAETFEPTFDTNKKRLAPVSHCWTPSGDMYCGCEGGQLLKIDTETQDVTVLCSPTTIQHTNGRINKSVSREISMLGKDKTMSPVPDVDEEENNATPDANPANTIREGALSCLALHKQGLFAGGQDGYLRNLDVTGGVVQVADSWKSGLPISSLCWATNYSKLAVGSTKGSIHMYDYSNPGVAELLSDTHFGNFVGVDVLAPGNQHCVSVRQDGKVQIWSMEEARLIGSVNIGRQASCIASCPSSHCAAVGTLSGHVYMIDATNVESPRIVQRLHLHQTPVLQMVYDAEGRFLITGSDDGHVFVADARPSAQFQSVGQLEVEGVVIAIATHTEEKHGPCKVAVTSNTIDDVNAANKCVQFDLPHNLIKDLPNYLAGKNAMLKDDAINKMSLNLSVPSFGAALTSGGVLYTLAEETKKLLKIVLPEEAPKKANNKASYLQPQEEFPSHELAGGSIILTLHRQWLASSAPDGVLALRDVDSLDQPMMLQAHSCLTGGVFQACFSTDAQWMLTCGAGDGVIACYKWNFSSSGKNKATSAIEVARSHNAMLHGTRKSEDQVLTGLADWSASVSLQASRNASMDVEGQEKQTALEKALEQDEIYMTPTPTLTGDPTWREVKEMEALRAEDMEYADVKKDLRNEIRELRRTIQTMMKNNETLPDIEKLGHDEFNLDAEEQQRLQSDGELRVEQIREEMEMEDLAKTYLREIIKNECWDSMAVKGRSIKAFHNAFEVSNYPMRARSKEETEELDFVTNMRCIEVAEMAARKEILDVQPKANTKGGEGEEGDDESEEGEKQEQPATIGSLGAQYGGANELFYSQFELHTRQQKRNQIVLLQDAIYRIKEAYNKAFTDVYKQREQEIARIGEKNQRIKKILEDLHSGEAMWQPEMDSSEKPEKLLVVEEKEVKVAKFVTPEQKAKMEEEERKDAERREKEKGDNARERALDMMMGGVLEIKKEDELKKDVPVPIFATAKSQDDWTDDEKKAYLEYEKKCKELSEEREKYKKTLEAELKKLQTIIEDTTTNFDDKLMNLFNKKIKTEMVIFQEELKILRLNHALLIDEELDAREEELNRRLNSKKTLKAYAQQAVGQSKKLVEQYRDTYDIRVAEDKVMEKNFRKEFPDVNAAIVDQLARCYRRRPRGPRRETKGPHADTPIGGNNPYGERPLSARQPSHTAALLRALDELDDASHIPEGLIVDMPVWKRMCGLRRAKVVSEQEVKAQALTLADMNAFLQKRQEEEETLKNEMDDIMEELNRLRDVRLRFSCNLQVQFLLKQGQVEVISGPFIPEYDDSILVHRSVVEDLNGTIRQLGEQKIAAMTESKDFRKGIHSLEWEHKKMVMQIEDFLKKAKSIQMLKVSRELQDFLHNEDHEGKKQQQIQVLESTLENQREHHDKNVAERKKLVSKLRHTVKKKEQDNLDLDNQLEEMNVCVAERKHINDVNAAMRNNTGAAKRMQDIVQRRKLVDLAKAQAQEVAVLRAEVERLRMRTFPALVQVER